jgi:transcriptional regulator with XRE-family HTH domain
VRSPSQRPLRKEGERRPARRPSLRPPRKPADSIPGRPAPLLAIALLWLRERKGWARRHLAEVSGISKNQISDYEHNNRNLNRDRLEQLTAIMGYGSGDIEMVLLAASRVSAPRPEGAAQEAPEGPAVPPAEILHLIRQVALHLGVELAALIESTWQAPIVARHLVAVRAHAGHLWQRLERRTPAERRVLVGHTREFQTWALAERLAHESRRAGPRAQAALELARLAVKAAQLAPGSDTWRRRLEGYVRAFLADALRVSGDLHRARAEWETVWCLWHDGDAGDPTAILPLWRLFDLEASLRREAGELDAALDLLERAVAAAPRPAAGRLLLQWAALLEQTGDVAGAVVILRQAAFLAAASGSRLPLFVEFNLTVHLCQLGEFTEAAARLPVLRQLTVDRGDELDLLRITWLSGRVAAGLGHSEEACAAFDQARSQWRARRAPLEEVVVSLELAVLHLEAGRPEPVRRLAQEMAWTFEYPGVDGEALASLRRFCDAAKGQAATVEQARALLLLLDRSDHQLRTTATRWRLPPQKPT